MKKQLLFILISISVSSSVGAEGRYSSRYFDTAKDCSCIEKNLQDGQDCTRFYCKEMSGYKTVVSYDGSACDLGRLQILKHNKLVISIEEVPSKIEWRYAGSEPVALIYRKKGNSKTCDEQLGLSIEKETLFVAGLGKFAGLSDQVDAKVPEANLKAREIADRFLEKSKKSN